MKKLDKFYALKVAERDGDKWSWKWTLPSTYKTYYYEKVQIDRYFQKQSSLYVWHVNLTYLKALVLAGEKVAGTLYVLALSLCGGKRDAAFQSKYKKLKAILSDKSYDYYSQREMMYKIEKYIRTHALAVGVWDGGIKWRPPYFGELELKTVQEYYSRDKKKENFIIVDNTVYYLRSYSQGVEALFMKCVELAGSEHALALALARDGKEAVRLLKGFERMSFKQRRSIEFYATLFENYLSKNPQLFNADVAV